MATLYLAEQGAVLKKDGDTFQVAKDGKELSTIPAAHVDQVIVFGNVHLTTPVIHWLLLKGIDCVFCSSTGAVKEEDFGKSEDRPGMVRLKESAMKAFIGAFESRLSTEVEHPMTRGKASYRRCLELQARQLARIFLGQQAEYKPLLVR